jgi:hypothetical protein
MAKQRRCCECRDGEHDNFTDDVRLYVVRDPEERRIVKRGYLCSEHVQSKLLDGYELHRA